MELVNHTPLPVALVRSSGTDDMHVLFLCALTCRVGASGPLSLAPEQRPLVLVESLDGELGDAHFLREGVSVCAHGFVYPSEPGGARGEASLRVGDMPRAVAAFGPRVWQASGLGLAPSPPLAFERIEMAWQHAYGGHVRQPTQVLEVDGEVAIFPSSPVAYVINPDGVGFYTAREQAVGQPLPQLEHPARLVKSWDDRPEPFCFAPYPVWGGMRARAVIDPADGKADLTHTARLFSRAAPTQVFPAVPSGTEVVLTGMRAGGERLSFRVPEVPVRAYCAIGDERVELPLRLDAIDVYAEAAEVRFVFRGKHRYPLVRYEERYMVCEPSQGLLALGLPRGLGGSNSGQAAEAEGARHG